jgi:membrane fusion protein, multidrug efflux system
MSDSTPPTDHMAEPERSVSTEIPTNSRGEHAPSAEEPMAVREKNADDRRVAGKILSVLIIAGAVMLALYVWGILEQHPRTDDATARANVVGIVPRARGQILKLYVQDNQSVNEGDLLFEIDPDGYELDLEKAKAALSALDEEIEVARAQDAELKFAVKVAEAAVDRASAQFKQADDTLRRLQPLLPKGFATAEQVDQAQTAKKVATSALAAEEQRLNQAKVALSTLRTLTAQRPGAVATVKLAEVELSYCKVAAPFSGRVISLNVSAGAYASVGIPVFSLLDTRRWYVMANFREAEIRHMAPGTSAEVYLLSAPGRHFRGKVQGIGWAVQPEGEIDIPRGVPSIKRELNWVHIAQRFPVRIEITEPDPELFRMGASAVAIIKGEYSK